MNRVSKNLLLTNLLTLIVLGGIMVKEQYPQKILARFKKEEISGDTTRKSYWLGRDGVLAALPKDSNSFIFIGTSLTEYFELNELFHDCHLKNRGIVADNSEGVLNRLSPVVADHPKKIFLELGINDLGRGISREILFANYNRILDTLQLKCPYSKLYIQSILPVANSGHYPTYNNPQMNGEIRAVNTLLKEMAEKRKITFIDLYGKFEMNGEINPVYAIEDGLHLTGVAYQLWAEN